MAYLTADENVLEGVDQWDAAPLILALEDQFGTGHGLQQDTARYRFRYVAKGRGIIRGHRSRPHPQSGRCQSRPHTNPGLRVIRAFAAGLQVGLIAASKRIPMEGRVRPSV